MAIIPEQRWGIWTASDITSRPTRWCWTWLPCATWNWWRPFFLRMARADPPPRCSPRWTKRRRAWVRGCLRQWILRPQVNREEIQARLDAVEELKNHTVLREEIRHNLAGVQDLERLAGRVTLGVASPRDLLGLRQSLTRIPLLRKYLANCTSARLSALHVEMDELADVRERIETALADDPPALASDPGVIRRGYNKELDELRELSQHSKQIIAAMEERERKRTGIGSLKIRFNQVFGYYIEISKAELASGAAGFRTQADAGECGTLYDAGAEGIRAQSSGCRRTHCGNRAAAVCRVAAVDRRAGRALAAHCRGDRTAGRAGKFRAAGRFAELHAPGI